MERFYDENKIGRILGGEFFTKLKVIKEILQLELSLSDFERKCYAAKEIPKEKSSFYVSTNNGTIFW